MSYTLGDLIDEAGWIPGLPGTNSAWSEALLEQRINEHVNKKAAERLMELAGEFHQDHSYLSAGLPAEYAMGFHNGLLKAARVLEQN